MASSLAEDIEIKLNIETQWQCKLLSLPNFVNKKIFLKRNIFIDTSITKKLSKIVNSVWDDKGTEMYKHLNYTFGIQMIYKQVKIFETIIGYNKILKLIMFHTGLELKNDSKYLFAVLTPDKKKAKYWKWHFVTADEVRQVLFIQDSDLPRKRVTKPYMSKDDYVYDRQYSMNKKSLMDLLTNNNKLKDDIRNCRETKAEIEYNFLTQLRKANHNPKYIAIQAWINDRTKDLNKIEKPWTIQKVFTCEIQYLIPIDLFVCNVGWTRMVIVLRKDKIQRMYHAVNILHMNDALQNARLVHPIQTPWLKEYELKKQLRYISIPFIPNINFINNIAIANNPVYNNNNTNNVVITNNALPTKTVNIAVTNDVKVAPMNVNRNETTNTNVIESKVDEVKMEDIKSNDNDNNAETPNAVVNESGIDINRAINAVLDKKKSVEISQKALKNEFIKNGIVTKKEYNDLKMKAIDYRNNNPQLKCVPIAQIIAMLMDKNQSKFKQLCDLIGKVNHFIDTNRVFLKIFMECKDDDFKINACDNEDSKENEDMTTDELMTVRPQKIKIKLISNNKVRNNTFKVLQKLGFDKIGGKFVEKYFEAIGFGMEKRHPILSDIIDLYHCYCMIKSNANLDEFLRKYFNNDLKKLFNNPQWNELFKEVIQRNHRIYGDSMRNPTQIINENPVDILQYYKWFLNFGNKLKNKNIVPMLLVLSFNIDVMQNNTYDSDDGSDYDDELNTGNATDEKNESETVSDQQMFDDEEETFSKSKNQSIEEFCNNKIGDKSNKLNKFKRNECWHITITLNKNGRHIIKIKKQILFNETQLKRVNAIPELFALKHKCLDKNSGLTMIMEYVTLNITKTKLIYNENKVRFFKQQLRPFILNNFNKDYTNINDLDALLNTIKDPFDEKLQYFVNTYVEERFKNNLSFDWSKRVTPPKYIFTNKVSYKDTLKKPLTL